MNTDEHRAAIVAILDHFDGQVRASVQTSIGRQWMWGLFSRAVFLTGGGEPLYADIDLRDENGPVGSLVVITQRVIVRATFANPVRDGSDFKLDVLAEAVPRSAVKSVSVESILGGTQPQQAWPQRARVKIHLDRKLAGTTTVTLPQQHDAYSAQAEALAATVHAIL